MYEFICLYILDNSTILGWTAWIIFFKLKFPKVFIIVLERTINSYGSVPWLNSCILTLLALAPSICII